MKAKTRKAATPATKDVPAQKPIDERQRLYELLLKWSKPIVWEDFASRGAYQVKLKEIADAFEKEAERGNQLEWVPGTAKGNLKHSVGLVELCQDEIAEIKKLLAKLRPDLTAEFVKALEMLVASDAARSAERIERILDKFLIEKSPAPVELTSKPTWDGSKLQFNGVTLKQFRKHPAQNQRKLLDAFQSAGWPERIQNPWHDPKLKDESVPLDTLNETLRAIKKTIVGSIRFEATGNGQCRWIIV